MAPFPSTLYRESSERWKRFLLSRRLYSQDEHLPSIRLPFESTLITGLSHRSNSIRRFLIYRNCSSLLRGSRGLRLPDSIALKLTRRRKSSPFNSLPTVFGLILMRYCANSAASFLVVFRVHFKPVIGSPAVSCRIARAISMCVLRLSSLFFKLRRSLMTPA